MEEDKDKDANKDAGEDDWGSRRQERPREAKRGQEAGLCQGDREVPLYDYSWIAHQLDIGTSLGRRHN